jgi:hypothetical protein
MAAKSRSLRDVLHLLQADKALRKLRPIPPEQTPQVEDRGLMLMMMLRWLVPPRASSPALLEAGLQQMQRTQGDQLRAGSAPSSRLGLLPFPDAVCGRGSCPLAGTVLPKRP